jgi:hypothetical protein
MKNRLVHEQPIFPALQLASAFCRQGPYLATAVFFHTIPFRKKHFAVGNVAEGH